MSGVEGSNVSSDMLSIPRFLVEDSPALAKRMKAFKVAEGKAKDAIALLGKASEIEDLHAQVVVDRDVADKAKIANRAECAQALERAMAKGQKIVEAAEREVASAMSKIEDQAAATEAAYMEAAEKVAEAKEETAYLDKREKKLTADRDALTKREEELDVESTLLLQEKSKLATVREQIDTLLG